MIFYGMGLISGLIYSYMWFKQKPASGKVIVSLVAFFSVLLGVYQRWNAPFESALRHHFGSLFDFLFLVAPYVLGLFSIAVMAHAFKRLRKRPDSRKYRVLVVMGMLMFVLVGVVFANQLWFASGTIAILEMFLDYLFLYFCLTFLIFLLFVLLSRLIRPSLDKNYVIILGTGLDRDGNVSRMLKYRLERAVAYLNAQLAQGMKPAILVVSGGRGADQSASEAEVMKDYLLEKGVDETCILVEDQSINTHQNFLYSQRLMAENDKVVFVTNSYHVLRSGLFANQLGLHAEGIGAKTPLLYLPFALIREYLALLLIYRHVHMVTATAFILALYSYYA